MLILTLAVFLLSLPALLQNQREEYKTYLFFTVAARDTRVDARPVPELNAYDLVFASDIFAETVLGWFKNPKFIEDIETTSATSLPTLSTRKETKQNVMIFFTTGQKEQNDKISSAIVETIQTYIANYNLASNTTFSLVNVSFQTMILEPQLWLDLMLSLVGSFLVAMLALMLLLAYRKK